MKSFLRRHPVIALAAGLVILAVAGVALAPWWIDLGPVRRKIERAASSALAGTLTYERMDLSWFPRPEVVVHSAKVALPGNLSGTVRVVRVSPALWPLLRGRVVLTRLRVEGLDLAVTAGSSKAPKAASSPAPGWQQSLSSLGSRTLDVSVGPSRAVVSREGRGSLVLEGLRVDASLRSEDGRALLTLSRLSLDSPRLLLEGSLLADATASRVDAAAHGSALDVTDVRSKLLSFAGDDPLIADILGIVRGGTLTSFSFASSGKTPGDLGLFERMSIRAAVKDGKIRVPGPNLDLADVAADVALVGGALTAQNASARVGKSRAEGGRVLVGLAGGDDRLRVEAQVKADLAEIPAILGRVIPSRSFHEELALVEGLRGSATGRITIGDLKSAPATNVAVSDMRFTASYRRLPWPVEVRGGRFSFDGTRVGVSRLSGSVGRSTFSGLTARVRLGKGPRLEAASGSIDVSLEDFLEGVRKSPHGDALGTSVTRLSGSARIDVRRFAGPLARLAEASVDASGTFKGVFFEASSLPPLSIPSGRFALGGDALRVTDADVRTLDAALRVSGVLSGLRGGAPALEATADGELGPGAVQWGWKRASLPEHFVPATPVALGGVRLSLAGGALSLGGGFVVANGPRVTLDLSAGGGTTDVRDLTIADGGARASIVFHRQAGKIDVGFKGRLDVSTVGKLFAEGRPRPGGLEGDFRASVPDENFGRLTGEGALTAVDLEIPTPAGAVTVERLDARVAGNRVDVTSSSLVLDGQRLSAAGSATFRDGAIALDLNVATGDLSWTRVEGVLGRLEDARKREPGAAPVDETKAAEAAPKSSGRAPVSILGDVRVSLESFTYGPFVWKPVAGSLRFEKDALAARIDKAEICGISTTGHARFLPGGTVALTALANAAGPDVNIPLACLGVRDGVVTGSYEARVQLEGEGAASLLPRALRGPLTFKAANGGIGKTGLFTRILTALNGTEVFAGKNKTRVGEAMPYGTIAVAGEVADGRFSIGEATFVAPSMTMAATGTVGVVDRTLDLTVLSHPLSTLDKVVQAVPVVRHILGRDFLAVAVKVTGTLENPVARVTPGRDVGKGLVGILERTVTMPVKVFDPPAPGVGSPRTSKEDE